MFDIHINPSYEASSDVILIDNFHLDWRRVAGELMCAPKFIENFNRYKLGIENWTKVSLDLEYNNETGLTHVRTQTRAALDLWPEGRNPCYRSHNIHSPLEVCTVVALMTEYFNNMSFLLDRKKV